MKRLAWINVGVGAVIMVATLPGRTQGLGLITEPMLRDLNLDRVTYAHINLWATLLGAAICLPAGRIFDRLGLRWTTVLTMLMLSGVVWEMSRLSGSVLLLFALILATRALGQSALSIASITAVAKSFDQRIGLAMGLYSTTMSLLFAAAFSGVGAMVLEDGWRSAWSSVAAGLALVAAPFVALGLQEPPRSRQSTRDAGGPDVGGVTLSDALRTPAFWVFAGAVSLYGLVSSGLGLFNQAVLAELGFTAQNYYQFLSLTSLIGLAGQMVCGVLTLRVSFRALLVVALFVYGLALALLPMVATLTQLWGFAALVGLSGGMISVIFFAIWRRAYGAAHLGRIQGAAQMLTVLASATGPLLFAQCAESTGSYMPVLWLLSPIVILLGVAAIRVSLPAPKENYEYAGRPVAS
jgi:MFS family permease